jgi:hypothetical protein
MQTIEIVVFIVVTMLAAGILVSALWMIDYKGFYKDTRKGFSTEKDTAYKVKADGFADQLYMRWEQCRFGLDNGSYSVFVEDKASIDRESLVKELLRVDRCDAIDCRNRSDRFIVNGTIATPKIIYIRCFNNSLIVS